jgi:hypothetical protein
MAFATINKGASYFNAVTYTGTGSSLANTSVGFQPDWVWIKSRSDATDHKLTDAVRGTTKALISDTTGAETTDTNGLTAFGSTGFTVGTDTNYNNSGATYVAWNWLGANSTATNTNGSITSTVSANTTSGFSVVSYTGAGATGTVGHGLGVAPKMVIVKSRNNAYDWQVYHESITNAYYLQLSSTGPKANAVDMWNNTSPTSSVFSVKHSTITSSGNQCIAYCFAEVKGYSKFSSFTGNGSSDGTFVYTGFKPAYIMMKSSSTGGAGYNWGIFDNKRLGYNVDNNDLRANQTNAEGTDDSIDILSNGFKIRSSSGGFGGGSGITYIYMAFAENPFVTSGGIPVTAR